MPAVKGVFRTEAEWRVRPRLAPASCISECRFSVDIHSLPCNYSLVPPLHWEAEMTVPGQLRMVQGHWALGTGSRDCSLNQMLFSGATTGLNLSQALSPC